MARLARRARLSSRSKAGPPGPGSRVLSGCPVLSAPTLPAISSAELGERLTPHPKALHGPRASPSPRPGRTHRGSGGKGPHRRGPPWTRSPLRPARWARSAPRQGSLGPRRAQGPRSPSCRRWQERAAGRPPTGREGRGRGRERTSGWGVGSARRTRARDTGGRRGAGRGAGPARGRGRGG